MRPGRLAIFWSHRKVAIFIARVATFFKDLGRIVAFLPDRMHAVPFSQAEFPRNACVSSGVMQTVIPS